MMVYVWVALGGGLGSAARLLASTAFARLFGAASPWGVAIVNITGSFVMGLLAAATARQGRLVVAPEVRQFLLVGLCGGYTTFSAFSLQTLDLIREGSVPTAGANIFVSVAGCLLGVWLGAALGEMVDLGRG